MSIFEWFLTPQFFVLSMLVWALVWLQRKLVENVVRGVFNRDIKESKLWRSLFLPAGPLGTGMLFGWLVTTYPYPESFADNLWGRIGYGLVAGLFSMQLYRILKEWFKRQVTKTKKDESEPKSPDSSTPSE